MILSRSIGRRSLLKAGLVAGASQIAAPFVLRAQTADVVKIGLDNPLTGAYAANGKNELAGCQLALAQINAKGGILGRKVELVVEDSTTGDAGTAVQKARKLIDGDKVSFLLGNVNSALSLAMAQVAAEKKVIHIVPGGHTDAITGTSCHWNVFRVCNATQMEASAVAGPLDQEFRQEMVLHHAGLLVRPHAGSRHGQGLRGARRQPRRRRSRAAGHDRFFLLPDQGAVREPRRHRLPHAGRRHGQRPEAGRPVRLGQDHPSGRRSAGARGLEGLPPEARIGTWVMEWYWNQPGVPHVAEFVEAAKKQTGRVPTARTWFGFVSTWTCALAAERAKSLDAVQMAKALQGFELPPEIALGPNKAIYRAGQNQLLASLFVGTAQASGAIAR